MGSVSAMSSVQRVVDKHSDVLKEEMYEALPLAITRMLTDIAMIPEITTVKALAILKPEYVAEDGFRTFEVGQYDIDELADRFPDCEVAY